VPASKKGKKVNPSQSARFIEAAKKAGVTDESFERALNVVLPKPKAKKKH
jgi:hypothetical protein